MNEFEANEIRVRRELIQAAAEGNNATLKRLLDDGVDVNSRGWPDKDYTEDYDKRDDQRWAPLSIAVDSNQAEAAEFLIERGAIVDVKVGEHTILLDRARGGNDKWLNYF
jgi:ankyrin repeat protein